MYRSIENGTHYPLDVSAGEDRCRVRHPVAVTVLGILRRACRENFAPGPVASRANAIELTQPSEIS